MARLLILALVLLASAGCQRRRLAPQAPGARLSPARAPLVSEERTSAQSRSPAGRPRCEHCEETLVGSYLLVDGESYHRGCYEQVGPRCGICERALMGRITLVGPGPGYHDACFQRSTRCDACSLPVQGARGGRRVLEDGRIQCRICADSAVLDHAVASAAFEEARAELEAVLGLDLDELAIKLEVVDRFEIARVARSDKPNIKGFARGVRQDSLRDGVREKGEWRITIWALYGLPREAFLGVLVHELFHAWHMACGPEELEDEAWREGAANYAQWRVMRRRSQGLWCLLLEQDPDPAYGEGFRRFRRWAEARSPDERNRALAFLAGFPKGY